MMNRYLQLISSYRARLVMVGAVLLVALFASAVTNPYQPIRYESTDTAVSAKVRAEVVEVYDVDSWKVRVEDGPRKGVEIDLKRVEEFAGVNKGDTVLVSLSETQIYTVIDRWRIPGMITLAALLIISVTLISGRKGLNSLVGLVFGIVVIVIYTIPAIISGASAFLSCIVTAFGIGTISVFVSHGMNFRALISTIAIGSILGVTIALAALGGAIVGLTGVTDDVTSYFFYNTDQHIDLYGLALGSIILATLGVLDDVVTTQVAATDEISKANSRLHAWSLFRRTMSVGNEHIAALINTLVLAYVGVSLPMLAYLMSSKSAESPLLLINTEFIALEVTRTLVSSVALVLAVPISSAIAALCYKRGKHLLRFVPPPRD